MWVVDPVHREGPHQQDLKALRETVAVLIVPDLVLPVPLILTLSLPLSNVRVHKQAPQI